MSSRCLPAYVRTKYLADLARVQEQIAELETSMLEAMKNGEVEQYRFDSGEGSQSAQRRSLKELETVLSRLENKELRILRKLNGRSIVNIGLRRKGYGGGYYGR